MADIRAAQSGDFSATSTWVGGVVPGSGDVAFANTFTVTISDTRTVQAISNASGTGITAGGTFSLLNGCNLTCTNANGVVAGSTATSCITTVNLGAGSSASVASNVGPATVASQFAITHSTSGTLSIAGNIAGGGVASSNAGISLSGTGTVNVTGNVTGSLVGTSGITVTGTGTATIVGNVSGVTVFGVSLSGNGSVTITGSVTAGANNGAGASNSSTSGILTINGTCQSSTGAPAIAAGSATQITRLSGPFLLGASGNINPVAAFSWRWAPTQIPTYYEVVASNGSTKRNLFTSDNIPTANYPTANNVRSGTTYGPNLENTGSLAVPVAGNVALGVAVDNTTGTAVLTSANVQTALGAFSSGRLSNVATVDSTGAQIQAAVSA